MYKFIAPVAGHFKWSWYILLTPSPWTTLIDLVHGLLEWTTHLLP